MASFQDQSHPEGHDYESGSPHLKHSGLRGAVTQSLRSNVVRILNQAGSCRVLEVGAGHGDFTDALLGAGAEVVVTEMSSASATALAQRYEGNTRVRVIHDGDGDWLEQSGERFDLVACISVLHHIPDYLAFLQDAFGRVTPGGGFVSWQDPLWYPRRTWASMTAEKAAYFGWRVTQGDLVRGVQTRARRLRGILDESNEADMVEYHVVRDGVDEMAIRDLALRHFDDVEVVRYWSTQSRLLQSVGERSGIRSTFGIVATGAKSPVGQSRAN